jgi:pyrroloquinoline quinone (PQQ) biosynthesis protein C
VRHPYLQALAEGSLPDTRWALADFARNYYGYSSHFPRYLTTVISRLENPAHRKSLLENLTEESGVYGDEEYAELATFGVKREWIEGIAHPLLFQRFSRAMGVDHSRHQEKDQVVCWREMFLSVLAEGGPAEALGALGIGTENIVRTIYGPFVKALSRLDLRPEDTVFFPLHTAVDDHHQATLEAISADFAATEEGRVGLRRGMLKALALRSAFWDWLHDRALNPAQAESVA